MGHDFGWVTRVMGYGTLTHDPCEPCKIVRPYFICLCEQEHKLSDHSHLFLVNMQYNFIESTIDSLATQETRGSAIAEKPRDALRQLKYYGRFFD